MPIEDEILPPPPPKKVSSENDVEDLLPPPPKKKNLGDTSGTDSEIPLKNFGTEYVPAAEKLNTSKSLSLPSESVNVEKPSSTQVNNSVDVPKVLLPKPIATPAAFKNIEHQEKFVQTQKLKDESKKDESVKEDEENYFYKGAIFPKSQYIKAPGDNLIEKKPTSWGNLGDDITNALTGEATQVASGAVKAITEFSINLNDALGTGDSNNPNPIERVGLNTVASLNKANDWQQAIAQQNQLPDNTAGNVAHGIIQTIPMIAAFAITGGGSVEAKLAAKGIKSTADIVIDETANPLTKYLTVTEGLKEEAKDNSTLASTLGAAAEGFKQGTILAASMGLAGRLTSEQIANLAIDNKFTQSLVQANNVGKVFAVSSAANDILSGKNIDLDQMTQQYLTGFSFEMPHLVKSVGATKLEKETQAAGHQSINEDILRAVSNDNAIFNFFQADPESLQHAIDAKGTHQDYQLESLNHGVNAGNAENLADKQAEHVAQLTLQKVSDLKFITEKILEDKDAFLKKIDESTFSDQQKEAYKSRVNAVYEFNQPIEIEKRKLNSDIKDLESQVSKIKQNVQVEPIDKIKQDLQVKAINDQITEKTKTLTNLILEKNGTEKINQQKGIQSERENGNESRKTPETGSSNRLQREKKGEEKITNEILSNENNKNNGNQEKNKSQVENAQTEGRKQEGENDGQKRQVTEEKAGAEKAPAISETKQRVIPYTDPDTLKGKGFKPDEIMHFKQGFDNNTVTLVVDSNIKQDYSTKKGKDNPNFKHILKDVAKEFRANYGQDVIVDLKGIDINQPLEKIIEQVKESGQKVSKIEPKDIKNLEKIGKENDLTSHEVRGIYNKYGEDKPLGEITTEDFKKARDKQSKSHEEVLSKLETLKEKEEESKLGKNPEISDVENQLSDLKKRLLHAPVRFKKGGELSQKQLRSIISNVKQQLREAKGIKSRKTQKVKTAFDKLDPQTEDDFIAMKLAGIKVNTESFQKTRKAGDIPNGLRLKYLNKDGVHIDKIAHDLINEGGIFEHADAKDLEAQIISFMEKNHSPESYAKKVQNIPDYEKTRYDEESAYAEQKAKELDEQEKVNYYDQNQSAWQNNEDYINSLTDEEINNIHKNLNEETINELVNESEKGNEDNFFNDKNFPPINKSQNGKENNGSETPGDNIGNEQEVNGQNREDDKRKIKILDQKIKDARALYNLAEKNYLNAKKMLENHGKQDQVSVFGGTPAEAALFRNNLGDQRKQVDALKEKVAVAKENWDKALAARDDFGQIKIDSFDKVINSLDNLKIDTKNTLSAFGIAPKIWNTSIDIVKAAIVAGKNVHDAIQEGVKYLKSKIKDFDENTYVDHMKEKLGVKPEDKTPSEPAKKTTGVSKASQEKRAEELGIEPAKRKSGVTAEEALKKGQESILKGADAEKIAEEYKKTGKISIDDFNVLTSHADELARQTNLADDKFGTDSKEFKDALQKELDWNKEIVNPIANEFFHQTGMRLQADVEIDTGSYAGIKKAIEKQTGQPITTKQTKEAKDLAEKIKSLTDRVKELEKKLSDAIEGAVSEANKNPVSIKERTQRIAATIRKGKLSRPDIFSAASPASIVWDGALEVAAKTIEKGGEVAQAINDALDHIENSNWFKGLGKNDKEKAKAGLTDYFNDVVENNDVRTKFTDKKDSKFTLDEVKQIWDYAKREYIDKGRTFGDMLKGMALETGLTTTQIRDAIATPKNARVITDEMYVTNSRRRSAINAAKTFVAESNKTALGKFLSQIPSFFFKLKTFGHGTVGGVTHAGTNIFRPSEWKHYIPFFLKQFVFAFGNRAKYEQAMEDLQLNPTFNFWKRSGLAVDPVKAYDDYQKGKNFFSKAGEIGDRGFNALKVYRLDLANHLYDNLSDIEKADPETPKTIAKLVNHSTGTHEVRIPKWTSKVIFAPSLEASKWANLIIDPAKAAHTFTRWSKSTPSEKAAAKVVARRAGEMIATYSALLAANAAFNSLTSDDPKDKVNWNDPLKSDFGKFKVAGEEVDISAGMLPTIRFIASLVHESYMAYTGVTGQGEQPEEKDYINLMTQIRYKMSPFFSTVVDVVAGTDAMGKPIPFSKVKGKHGQEEYKVWEYLAKQQTPIPLAEGVKVVMDEMEQKGMSKPQAMMYLKGVVSAVISGGTGAKLKEGLPVQTKEEKDLEKVKKTPHPNISNEDATKIIDAYTKKIEKKLEVVGKLTPQQVEDRKTLNKIRFEKNPIKKLEMQKELASRIGHQGNQKQQFKNPFK